MRWIYLGLGECIEITEALGWLRCWQQEVFTFTMGDRYMQLVFTVMGSIVSCSWDGALICLASSALCVPHSVSPGKVLIYHTAILICHTGHSVNILGTMFTHCAHTGHILGTLCTYWAQILGCPHWAQCAWLRPHLRCLADCSSAVRGVEDDLTDCFLVAAVKTATTLQ